MSVLTWPRLKVAAFHWRQVEQAIAFKSAFGAQSLEIASPRWEVDLTGVVHQWPKALQIVRFLESFHGYRHQLALYNLIQPVPAGTLRGILQLALPAAQGAVLLHIAAGAEQAGRTLLAGDLLGIGANYTQQVLRVQADATADAGGNLAVELATPLRNAFGAGVQVVWDRPKALFRQRELNQGIQFVPKFGQPWSLSLVEDCRP